jgi:NAD(P)-dependent dehydrogenase (short-subunit alcohol dehydrogenase family)
MDLNDRVEQLTKDLDLLLKNMASDNDSNKYVIPEEKAKYLDPLLARLRHTIRHASTKSTQSTQLSKLSSQVKSEKIKNPCCYMCKVKLWKDDMRHNTYYDMCQLCGNINYNKRDLKKDLTGKVAIITGGRIKIGFETAIRLLRNGCTVIVTSRFIDDCLERYEKDKDFEKFKDRLFIYQLNMLDGNNITKFVKYIFKNFTKIDYLINNAAQTIKRPKEFFNHLLDKMDIDTDDKQNQKLIVHRDNSEIKLLDIHNELLIGYDRNDIAEIFPKGERDIFGQQIDLRTNNSWMLEADEVNLRELAEVYIINSIAPYILSTKLKPIMTKTNKEYSWIINVTSMEGVFNWDYKPSRHPHTNMAKAALNMLTRTCGQYYIKSNIVMVCVDTGWNNPQQPNSYDFQTPVDCSDGAARILDPIYRELKQYGILYKDFEQHAW